MPSGTPRFTHASLHAAVICGLIVGFSLAPVSVRAQSGANSTFMDPSIEDSGMGRASVAVFWEDDLNDWSNPALLGYQRGIRYSYGKTQLVPDLAKGVFFTSDRFAIGGWGLGVSIAGKPVDGLGGLRLDYGVSEATDADGNVIGTFDSYEDIRQIGVGVSVVKLFESIVNATGGRQSHLSRHVDLSLGHAWKHVIVDLAPASVTIDQKPARGEANQRDRGALLRITPLGASGRNAVKLDLSSGYSQRNYTDATIGFIDVDQAGPIAEERVVGGAARLSLRLEHQPGALWDVLSPTVTVGGAYDEARYYAGGIRLSGDPVRRSGQEVTMLGLVTMRHGFVDDPSGDIGDDTWGFGVGLQYRGIASVRYDWAAVPQAKLLRSNVHRWGITASFDPCRLVSGWGERGGGVAAR